MQQVRIKNYSVIFLNDYLTYYIISDQGADGMDVEIYFVVVFYTYRTIRAIKKFYINKNIVPFIARVNAFLRLENV